MTNFLLYIGAVVLFIHTGMGAQEQLDYPERFRGRLVFPKACAGPETPKKARASGATLGENLSAAEPKFHSVRRIVFDLGLDAPPSSLQKRKNFQDEPHGACSADGGRRVRDLNPETPADKKPKTERALPAEASIVHSSKIKMSMQQRLGPSLDKKERVSFKKEANYLEREEGASLEDSQTQSFSYYGCSFNPQKQEQKDQKTEALMRSYQDNLEAGKLDQIPIPVLLQIADFYRHTPREEDGDKAIDLLQHIIKNPLCSPESKGDAALKLGKIFKKKNQWDKVEEFFGQALSLSPNSLKIIVTLGDYYFYTKAHTERAVQLYGLGLSLAQKHNNIFYMGLFHISLGRASSEKAEGHYRQALQVLDEEDHTELKAQAFIGLGNIKAGVENYQNALDLLGAEGNIQLRAKAYIGLGKGGQGEDNYKTALGLLKDHPDVNLRAQALMAWGYSLKIRKNFKEAETKFRTALNLNPIESLKDRIHKALASYGVLKKNRL